MIASIKAYRAVAAIVLGVSEGPDNIVYKNLALRNEIDFIFGNEEDV